MDGNSRVEHKSEEGAELLAQCLAFIREIDALRAVERRTKPICADRRENSAEHSWHLAMMALVLAGHADREIDLNRVLRMLLVHDLPEVYAGDVFVYERTEDHTAQERAAARRLFGMLPGTAGGELLALWEEFEDGQSAEAQFARALDRFQPCFCNFHNDGGTWREYGITREKVLATNAPYRGGFPALWTYFVDMVEKAGERGYFPAGEETDGDER